MCFDIIYLSACSHPIEFRSEGHFLIFVLLVLLGEFLGALLLGLCPSFVPGVDALGDAHPLLFLGLENFRISVDAGRVYGLDREGRVDLGLVRVLLLNVPKSRALEVPDRLEQTLLAAAELGGQLLRLLSDLLHGGHFPFLLLLLESQLRDLLLLLLSQLDHFRDFLFKAGAGFAVLLGELFCGVGLESKKFVRRGCGP